MVHFSIMTAKKTRKSNRKTHEPVPLASRIRSLPKTVRAHPKKAALIASVPLLALLLFVVFLVMISRAPRIGIAFYRVPESLKNAIISEAEKAPLAKKPGFRIIPLEDDKSLTSQLNKNRKIALLFTEDGYAAERLAPISRVTLNEDRRLMPSAMRSSGTSLFPQGKDISSYALPILIDHLELIYHKKTFEQITPPEVFSEIESRAQQIKENKGFLWALSCAGGNDEDLLAFVGAVYLSQHGDQDYRLFVEALRGNPVLTDLLATTKLKETLTLLTQWKDKMILHPEWYNFTRQDIEDFMWMQRAPMAVISLSHHRAIANSTLQNYDSTTFPTHSDNPDRLIIAPVYVGLRPNPRLDDVVSTDFLRSLITNSVQERLASQTGFSPVNSTAQTRDKQASDLRLWAARSRRPVPDPFTASLDNPFHRMQLAKALREYLMARGTGY